jgi:DNA repair photolyase
VSWYKDILKSDVIKYVSFGFTLTGADEDEPGASPNKERVRAIRELHNLGFKTFVSAEPIIDIDKTLDMICDTIGFVHLYKIGLKKGAEYDVERLKRFFNTVISSSVVGTQPKYYWKNSILNKMGYLRERLPANCVGSDYNIFNN